MRALLSVENVTAGDGASTYTIGIQAAIAAASWVRTPCKVVVKVFNREASGTKRCSFIAPDLVDATAANNTFDTADTATGQGTIIAFPIDFDATTTVDPLVRAATSTAVDVTAYVLTGNGA